MENRAFPVNLVSNRVIVWLRQCVGTFINASVITVTYLKQSIPSPTDFSILYDVYLGFRFELETAPPETNER